MSTTSPPRTIPVFSALLCAAPASWIVMMISGALLMAMIDVARAEAGGHPMLWGEFATAFVLAASLPFALVIGAVYLPVVVAMRRANLPGEPVALFALAGLLAAPAAGALLLVLGHFLFGYRFSPPLTVWEMFGRVFTDRFMTFLPSLLALMLGGAVFGGGFAWACRYAERPFR